MSKQSKRLIWIDLEMTGLNTQTDTIIEIETVLTKQNLKIINVDQNNKLISIKGSVPGKKNTVVLIKDAIKKSHT